MAENIIENSEDNNATLSVIDEKAASMFCADFASLESEINKSILGQGELVRNVAIAMVAGGNVLLEGLPGLGKTQLVKTIGKALSLSFSRIQFTPDLMPSDVTGTDVFKKLPDGSSGFQFQKGPLFANIVLADEINRATPKTQSALLEAMQEKTVTIGSATYKLPEPFFVLATQNPLEMEGTYPLPEAQMDRFLFQLIVRYPGKDELAGILELTTKNEQPPISSVFGSEKLSEMSAFAKRVPAARAVVGYIAEIVLKTHPDSGLAGSMVKKYVRYGASPRAGQALLNCARISALLNGRYNVSYSDVNALIPHAMRHRVMLNFDAVSDGVSVDDILASIVTE